MTRPSPRLAARIAAHARGRGAALGGIVALAILARVAVPSPPVRSVEGVARLLGDSVGGEVKPDDFVWESGGGFFADAIVGRRVLFLASRKGAPRELHRARVRLTRSGRPLEVADVATLTDTPLGDDGDLVASGKLAAFTTRAEGALQGVTLLDFGDAKPGFFSALKAARHLGDVRRVEVAFDEAPAELKLELQGELLVLALGKEAEAASIDASATLVTSGRNAYGAEAHAVPDVARSRFEKGARDALGEGAGRAAKSVERALAGLRTRPTIAPSSIADRTKAPAPEDGFPPARIAPPISPALPAEGEWLAPAVPIATGASGVSPIYEARVRPDANEPDALVHLVALDTRQLDLGLVPGLESPRPTTGPRGSGRLPRAASPERVVAAFAASDAPEGFVAEGRALIPPREAPSIAIERDGVVGVGTIEPSAGVFAALLQPGPARDANQRRERSALARTANGQLVYAWSARASEPALRRALVLAGAETATRLSDAPSPAGFSYAKGGGLTPGMTFNWDPAAPSAASFFFASLRDVTPAAGWTVDPNKQPSPAFLPGVLASTSTALGATVHLLRFTPGRVLYRLRGGPKEPQTKAAAALPAELPAADMPNVLAAIGLGTGRRKGARGLSIDGQNAFRFHDDGGVLILGERPQVLRGAEAAQLAPSDATELPLTADAGKIRPEARDVGAMRARFALCTLDDGTLMIASSTFDSDEATSEALIAAGCSRVVAVDRGAHDGGFLHRAGTDPAPQNRYEVSTLYILAAPAHGRASKL